MTETVRYSDINATFDFHPIKEDLVPLVNEKAIKTSIKNILFTTQGERFYNPNLGGGIRGLLFELAYDDIQFVLEEQIRTVISNYEPRCFLQGVKVESNPDQNGIKVTITFSVINIPTPVTLDILLERIR